MTTFPTNTITMPNKQPPAFSFHLGFQQERALRYLVNDRTHPTPEPPTDIAHAFSVRLGPLRELALSQLARNKNLHVEIVGGEEVSRPKSGWLLLIKAAIDAYLDRECPGWDADPATRAGGNKSGWAPFVQAAIDEYLDQELPHSSSPD